MFEFLGKMMGISLRNKMCLPFSLADVVYKRLIGQNLQPSDLKTIDQSFCEFIETLQHCETRQGITCDEMFLEMYGDIPFEVTGSDGEKVNVFFCFDNALDIIFTNFFYFFFFL